MSTLLVVAALSSGSLALQAPASAAGRTVSWDGRPDSGDVASDAHWTTPQNWVGDQAPSPGDTLVFPDGVDIRNTENDFPAYTVFDGLTFGGAQWRVTGNPLSLATGIRSRTFEGHLEVPIRLQGDLDMVIEANSLSLDALELNGHTLHLWGPGRLGVAGPVTGDGGGGTAFVVHDGTLRAIGSNSFTGTTRVLGGTLSSGWVNTWGPVLLEGGAFAGFGGRVGDVTSVTGGTVIAGPQHVEGNAGSLAMNPLTTYRTGLGEMGYEGHVLLFVNGAVRLGAATLDLVVQKAMPYTGYMILSNDGDDPVEGTFAGLPEGAMFTSGGVTFRISYLGGTGNDVYVYSTDSGVVAPPLPPPLPPALPPLPGLSEPGSGYWLLAANGHVYAFGAAVSLGAPIRTPGGVETVDLEPTPSGNGYLVVDALGGVSTFGDAVHRGNVASARLLAGERVTSLSVTRSGAGYWIFTSRGRVFAFGDARHLGDMTGIALNGPVLDSIATPSGRGYYMVASDGGIFSFGDAEFHGSMGGHRLNQPVMSMAADPDGAGYWLVASDGGIFSFDAAFYGSMGGTPLNQPVSGMVPGRHGYLMVAEDGGIFAFGAVTFHGSLGADPPDSPVVAVALMSDLTR